MRRSIQVAVGALLALLLGATGVFYQKYHQAAAGYQNMRAEEESTRERYGQAIGEIAAIQDSLNAIVLGDSAARLVSSDLEVERRLSETGGDAALARIAVLKAGIERTKVRIEQLDKSLKRSGMKIAGMQKMLATLKKTVAEKEEQVAQLTTQVNSLQTEVASNHETIQQQTEQIEEKRRELGTIYYVVGTKKDLTKSGVVVAKGGVLGVRKTLTPSGQVQESMFTALDTDQQTMIEIPVAKTDKVQVLSAQPPASYSLEKLGDRVVLRIVDPQEFRSVKHLIIMTA
jgi:hypothetical protein